MEAAILDPKIADRLGHDEQVIRTDILSNEFWNQLIGLQTLLQPFLSVIISLEANEAKLSHVFSDFWWLLKQTDRPGILEQEVTRVILSRWKFLHKPVMTIAAIVDVSLPEVRRITFAQLHSHSMLQEVSSWLKSNYGDMNAAKIFAVLVKLCNKTQPFNDVFVMENSKLLDPIDWWKTFFHEKYPEVVDMVAKVLSISASSGPSERNFSTHGLIHTKLRNRLGNERVQKLVFMNWNLKLQLQNQEIDCIQFFDGLSDDEEE